MTSLLMQRAARERTTSPPAVRRNTAIVVSGIFFFILVQIILHPIYIPPDAALHLECGLQLAEGKVPYRDFFDVAAPMLMYLHLLPALSSKLIPLHPVLWFNLFVFALSAGSVWLSAIMLFNTKMREQSHVPAFLIGISLALLIGLREFGQRDHVFLALYLPFLVCRWLSWARFTQKRNLALAAGIAGGTGICLDPLYMLVFLGMEIFFALSKQSNRGFITLEMKAALCTMMIYFLHFFLLPREVVDIYIHWALPMVFCAYDYWNDNVSYQMTSPDRRDLIYLMVLSTVVGLGLRRFCTLIPPMVALSIIGFGLFVMQGALYSHEALLMAFGAVMAGFLSVSVIVNVALRISGFNLERFARPREIGGICAIIVIALAILSYQKVKAMPVLDLAPLGYWGTACKADLGDYSEALEEWTKPGDDIVVLNYRVRHGYPVMVQLARKPGATLLWGFPIRMAKLMPEREPVDKARDYRFWADKTFAQLINDIRKRKPKIIMIDTDSFEPVLTENKVIEAIDQLYINKGTIDCIEYEKLHPQFDYVGFRNGYRLYVLKDIRK